MAVFASFLLLFPGACVARHRNQDCGGSTFCGHLNISYPFRLKNQPPQCGHHKFELECENNTTTTLVLRQGKFSVQEIDYLNYTMRMVDASLDTDDCSSLPRSPFYSSSFNDYDFYFYNNYYYYTGIYGYICSSIYVLNCTKPMISSAYIDASRCTNESNASSGSSLPTSFFYFAQENISRSDMNEACTVEAEVPIMVEGILGMTTPDIYNSLSQGFLLQWSRCDYTRRCIEKITNLDVLFGVRTGPRRYWRSLIHFIFNGPSQRTPGEHYRNTYDRFAEATGILLVSIYVYLIRKKLKTVGLILLRTLPGIFCLLALVMHKWRRRHLSMDDRIEEFLQTQNNLVPIRYSFKEIKKMTRNFKDKLGEGGFGSVFKGKLLSGHLVAVKLLGKSKGNGQDFINEVASIGRIHHANVAKLVGFCVEGSKQALVYDFMSNGSLDKIIFSDENKSSLDWTKMFDIVLGIARGIDYLHQGCDMQILHFDIKPHNILLDESFNPKVSDFGLAKLYSVDDSIVSLTAARGTIGYIAPELVYKNLGGVSYKADVYSFGMLLMEMIGRRKNLNAFADHSSQIYFPSWIYDRLDQGEDFELGDVSDEERIMVKKMLITAFWCIQLQPTDRPSMNKVLKMLETDIELLEMPRKPFYQLPLESSVEVHGCESSSTSSDAVTITSSNVV